MRGGRREGAGRPKGPSKVRMLVHVLPQTRKAVETLANMRCQPLGEVVDRQFTRVSNKLTTRKNQYADGKQRKAGAEKQGG